MANLSSGGKKFWSRGNAPFASVGFAVGRVDELLAKVFSSGSLLVGLQMLIIAWGQQPLLMPIGFWVAFSLMALAHLGLLYGAWISKRPIGWMRFYALAFFFNVITWGSQVPETVELPNGFYPWLWWGVGIAGIAAFGGFRPPLAFAFNIALNLTWFGLRFQEQYGEPYIWLNVQDVFLTFFFSSLLSTLVLVLRSEANLVDVASRKAIDAAALRAKADAENRERARLDALVHDSVLTTLLVAAKAHNREEEISAAQLASRAIVRLSTPDEAVGQISTASFFEALQEIALRQEPQLLINIDQPQAAVLTDEVASALTEATLQAIINSQQHAGTQVTRELRARSTKNGGIKIVVKDNGRGFRLSRVPKNRFGVRISIIDRVEAVGGRVFVDSKPGSGATIILEWQVQK